jgi:multidrug efflux pump subunit AcrA (membrane-fusion protein)
MSALTYRDVRTILALLDGWGTGRIHFRSGDLIVDAITAREDAATAVIPSPAVGVFTQKHDREGVGTVDAPLKSTPVGVPANTRVLSLLVEDGQFVQYGQPLAVVAMEKR